VVHHAYRFAPGTVVVAPPPAGSASDFVQGYVSLALMRWALPFLGLVSGYLFFRRLTPSLAGFLVKLRTRARTVLVPFVIWSGLGVLFAVAVTSSPYRDVSAYWTVHSISEALDRWLVHPVLVIAVLWWALGWQPEALSPWISATAFPPFIVGSTIAILGWRAPWAARKAAPASLTAVLAAAWLGTAALYAVYGHELGRWARAGLLPVVVLGIPWPSGWGSTR